jgi:hypothetical protein
MSSRTAGKLISSEETDQSHPYMQNEGYLHKSFALDNSATVAARSKA